MSVTTVTSTDYWKSPTVTESAGTTGTNSLSDFESFLQLLVTELSNQDPLEPVSSTEYVSQMAQISSLQQLQNLSSSMTSYQAFSLIGKEVAYQATDSSGQTVTGTGTVQSVITNGGATYLNLGETIISYDSLIEVSS